MVGNICLQRFGDRLEKTISWRQPLKIISAAVWQVSLHNMTKNEYNTYIDDLHKVQNREKKW